MAKKTLHGPPRGRRAHAREISHPFGVATGDEPIGSKQGHQLFLGVDGVDIEVVKRRLTAADAAELAKYRRQRAEQSRAGNQAKRRRALRRANPYVEQVKKLRRKPEFAGFKLRSLLLHIRWEALRKKKRTVPSLRTLQQHCHDHGLK
jgi:hypothetical protein